MAHTALKKAGMHSILNTQDVRVRRNLRDMGFVWGSLTAALVFLAVLSVYLWCRLTVVDIGYEISKANSIRDGLIEQNRRLKIEYMKLKSPERIERIASKELNLVHPSNGQIINIR
ncbi:MAG: cell division protein FtsL [Deltaproteobacteria bacterium]|nr:cell division protein FtsL [Deltaproteobacteria bacterium]